MFKINEKKTRIKVYTHAADKNYRNQQHAEGERGEQKKQARNRKCSLSTGDIATQTTR